MKSIRIIVPFDPITRQTILPVDKNGQPYALDFVHLAQEVGGTVLCEVRGEDAVIDAMKVDPVYLWLEEMDSKGVLLEDGILVDEEGVPIVTETGEPILVIVEKLDITKARDYMATKFPREEVDAKDWSDIPNTKMSIIQLYRQTLEDFKRSGLGYETDT